jgi:hypothetical protein
MNHSLLFASTLAILLPGLAGAQHAGYAGQEQRTIKSLSAEETQQYLLGAGMGYARVAELNHYPGPMHVLELEQPLALTAVQRAATQQLMDTHKAEARTIGARLIAAEQKLDRLFADSAITQAMLSQQVQTVAALRGEYRLSHLETHRRMHALLSPHQVMQYDQLRGYAGGNANSPQPRHNAPHH